MWFIKSKNNRRKKVIQYLKIFFSLAACERDPSLMVITTLSRRYIRPAEPGLFPDEQTDRDFMKKHPRVKFRRFDKIIRAGIIVAVSIMREWPSTSSISTSFCLLLFLF